MGDITRIVERAKKWKFTIYNTVSSWIVPEPIGWDDIRLTLTRSLSYKTLFRGFSADLQYYNDGYDALLELDEATGVQTEAYLKVEKASTQDGSYSEILNSKLDFVEWTQSSENRRGVNIPLVDSSFNEKLSAREAIDIPVDRATDLDGNEMDAIEYQDITFKGREFGGKGEGDVYRVPGSDEDPINEYDFSVNASSYIMGVSFDNVELLPNFQDTTKTEKTQSETTTVNCFYYTDLTSAEINITGSLVMDGGGSINKTTRIVKGLYSEDSEYISGIELYSETWQQSINESFDISTTLSPREGLFLITSTPTLAQGFTVYVREGFNLTVNYYSTFEATPCKVVMPHEAFQHLITSITGETDNFYSEYFGRTDLGYDEDGEGALVALTNGKLIRQFPTGYVIDEDDEDAEIVSALSFNFAELFENHYKKDNVGMQVTLVDGKYQVVIEKQSDLFKTNVVHSVDFITKGSFNRTRSLENLYSEINAGYVAAAEDLLGGLEEYISAISHSTSLSYVENTLDLISTYSAVTSRLEKQRRKPAESTSTEELIGDSQVFFIELWRDETTGELVQRETQGFTEVIGLDGLETKLNLGITPKQIMLNHGNEINVGLYIYPTGLTVFNTADKVTDLQLLKDGSDIYIVENQDVINGDFDNPLWSGYNIDFTSALGLSDYFEIQDDPNGLIEFTSPLTGSKNYGWSIEVGTGVVDKDNNMMLREAYPSNIGVVKVLGADEETALVTGNSEFIGVND